MYISVIGLTSIAFVACVTALILICITCYKMYRRRRRRSSSSGSGAKLNVDGLEALERLQQSKNSATAAAAGYAKAVDFSATLRGYDPEVGGIKAPAAAGGVGVNGRAADRRKSLIAILARGVFRSQGRRFSEADTSDSLGLSSGDSEKLNGVLAGTTTTTTIDADNEIDKAFAEYRKRLANSGGSSDEQVNNVVLTQTGQAEHYNHQQQRDWLPRTMSPVAMPTVHIAATANHNPSTGFQPRRSNVTSDCSGATADADLIAHPRVSSSGAVCATQDVNSNYNNNNNINSRRRSSTAGTGRVRRRPGVGLSPTAVHRRASMDCTLSGGPLPYNNIGQTSTAAGTRAAATAFGHRPPSPTTDLQRRARSLPATQDRSTVTTGGAYGTAQQQQQVPAVCPPMRPDNDIEACDRTRRTVVRRRSSAAFDADGACRSGGGRHGHRRQSVSLDLSIEDQQRIATSLTADTVVEGKLVQQYHYRHYQPQQQQQRRSAERRGSASVQSSAPPCRQLTTNDRRRRMTVEYQSLDVGRLADNERRRSVDQDSALPLPRNQRPRSIHASATSANYNYNRPSDYIRYNAAVAAASAAAAADVVPQQLNGNVVPAIQTNIIVVDRCDSTARPAFQKRDSGYRSLESQLSRQSLLVNNPSTATELQVINGVPRRIHSPPSPSMIQTVQTTPTVTNVVTPTAEKENDERSAAMGGRRMSLSCSDCFAESPRIVNVNQTRKQFSEDTRLSTDRSKWMEDWIAWRSGSGSREDPVDEQKATSDNTTAPAGEKMPSAAGPAAAAAAAAAAADTNGSSVWRALTRGVERTINGAEQSLSSVVTQAAELLLMKRRTSMDDQTSTTASTGDVLQELQPGCYGIKPRCSEHFVRTNFRTASKRRREFRRSTGTAVICDPDGQLDN